MICFGGAGVTDQRNGGGNCSLRAGLHFVNVASRGVSALRDQSVTRIALEART